MNDKPIIQGPVKIHASKQNKILKGLTAKQRKFVKAVATGSTATEAVSIAGYQVNSKKSASAVGSELMHKPHISTVLNQYIDAVYPNFTEGQATLLNQIQEIALDPNSTLSEKIKASEHLANIRGSHAAKKSATITADAKDFFRPPK